MLLACKHWTPGREMHDSGACRITHGPCDSYFPNLVGKKVASVRRGLATVFSIPADAEVFIGGSPVTADYRLRAGDDLVFLRRGWGRKRADDVPLPEAGLLLTVKEAAAELHCSISFVYKLMYTGQLAFERRGRRKLPLALSVAEYRRRNTCPATFRPSRPCRSPQPPYQYQRLFRERRSGPKE